MIVAQDPEKNAKHTIAPENDRAAIICLSPSSDAGSGDYYSGTLRFQYAKAQAAGFLAAVARNRGTGAGQHRGWSRLLEYLHDFCHCALVPGVAGLGRRANFAHLGGRALEMSL